MAFKVGDTVRLKSGGPLMTVQFVDSAGRSKVKCKWLVGTEVRKGEFIAEILKIEEPK